ncbi:hypothetical protein [Arthrobacter antioxidans]|uniref:hypothetical protein n=1 Tax=Arthrobacter antioxidans TaxID=2895818 RepID=UPI001FFF4DFB|nr:hypothetical protein [Arthrobacter antioxidans]
MIECPQQHSAQLAATAAGLTAQELWLHYFSVGGNLRAFELDAYLHGAHPLPAGERNLVAHALNEMIDALPPRPKAAFDDELALPEPLQDQV